MLWFIGYKSDLINQLLHFTCLNIPFGNIYCLYLLLSATCVTRFLAALQSNQIWFIFDEFCNIDNKMN